MWSRHFPNISPVPRIFGFYSLCGSFLCSLGGLSTYCKPGLSDLLARFRPVILGGCRVHCTHIVLITKQFEAQIARIPYPAFLLAL